LAAAMSKELAVYTRPKCILCAQVKELLAKANVPFRAHEVSASDEQEAIMKRHRAKSFPLLVLGGEYLGGFTHLVHLLSSGRLQSLLADGPES
jgi:glutaredoxin